MSRLHVAMLLMLLMVLLPGTAIVPAQGIGPITLTNVDLVTVDETSASVTWVTNLASDTKVEWGTTRELGAEKALVETTNYHVIWMTGLSQATIYFYRVGSGNSWTDIGTFTTLAPPGGAFSLQFAIVADPHIDADGSNNAAGAMYADGPRLLESAVDQINNDPQTKFVVMAGDMTNGVEADYELFADIMEGLDVPWFPLLGNWDKQEDQWAEYYMDATGRSDFYYSFNSASCHFVILDSAVQGQVGGSLPESQMVWLENDLNANSHLPTLVFLHHQADSTDEIFGLDPASKDRLDQVLSKNQQAYSLSAGHNHKNIMTQLGKRYYITTASTVQYPVGYGLVRIYGEGYTQSFHKVETELATSEESRIRMNTASADPNEDQQYLGVTLEDRSYVTKVPRNHPPTMVSVSVDPSSVYAGEIATVTTSATDEDGDNLAYDYSVTGGYIDGYGPSVTWNAPYEPGTYTVTVKASDGEFTTSSMNAELTVKERPDDQPDLNHPPIITSIDIDDDTLMTGEETKVSVVANDMDGDELTYEYEASGGTIVGSGSEVTYRAPSYPGTYSISVRVNDGQDRSEKLSAQVYVQAPVTNHAPTITRVMSDLRTVEPGGTVQLDVTADDEDGDALIYHYDVTDGTISGTGSKVQWTAPSYEGSFKIDVWVSDGEEQSKKESLTIAVSKPDDGEGDEAFIPGFDMGLVLLAMFVVSCYMIRKRDV